MSVESDQLIGMVYGAAAAVANSSVPFEGYIASSWRYMTDNYSEFTIATLFSVILHEVGVIEVANLLATSYIGQGMVFAGCENLGIAWLTLFSLIY